MRSPRLEERYRIIGTGQEAEQGNSDSQTKNLGSFWIISDISETNRALEVI